MSRHDFHKGILANRLNYIRLDLGIIFPSSFFPSRRNGSAFIFYTAMA